MALVMTSAGQRLNDAAAASYERLNSAFFSRFGKRLNISSGARTYDEQVRIFTTNFQTTPIRWSNGKYITRFWNGQTWYLKPGYDIAAPPGTSNHEYPPGRAADFGSGVQSRFSAEHNWMIANAGAFGWAWTGAHFATIEPWHWEHISGGASGGATAPEGFLMGLNDQQQTELYNGVSAIYSAMFGPNGTLGSMPNGNNLPTAVEQVRLAAASLQRYVYFGGADVKSGIGATESVFGLAIQTKAQVAALSAAVGALSSSNGIDPGKLQEIVDSAVKDALADVSISDPNLTPEVIAQAVADENDDRARKRLEED